MKILLLGDASNYHAALAHGLATLGHEVTLASNGGRWMQTGRDIDLSRHDNIVSGAILRLKLATSLSQRLKGYDIVQLASPGFVDLRPIHLRSILHKLKRDNGAVFATALGTDAALVRNLSGENPALPYSEWQYGQGLTPWALSKDAAMKKWLKPHLQRYTDEFYATVDGVVSALYEYSLVTAAEYPDVPLTYGGIPIVREQLPAPSVKPHGDRVRILYAVHPGRAAEKGADKLLELLLQLERELPGRVEILRPGPMPYAQFTEALAKADMVCDQLYSLTPSTTPLLGMATGTVPITGADDTFYNFIGEDSLRPIFNPDPRDLDGTYRRLREILTNTDELRRMSAEAPEFVARHNDATTVALRFTDFWTKD